MLFRHKKQRKSVRNETEVETAVNDAVHQLIREFGPRELAQPLASAAIIVVDMVHLDLDK